MTTSTQAAAKTEWIKQNLKPGELYAGILLGKDNQPDQHIILLPGDQSGLTWAKAKEFAKKAGGELPTRREQSLLFANLREEFQRDWYWSGEQHASVAGYAWCQNFSLGTQLTTHKTSQLRARAVRRLPI